MLLVCFLRTILTSKDKVGEESKARAPFTFDFARKVFVGFVFSAFLLVFCRFSLAEFNCVSSNSKLAENYLREFRKLSRLTTAFISGFSVLQVL